ncbi:MAG: mevalonate kinase [Asgard group archaeon]|nr:mevalonate kinase [Asgard group archaeon]
MRIVGSAPGKLILFGEHASSRDRPAIVFAINKRLEAILTLNHEKTNNILLSSKELNIENAIYPDNRLDLLTKTIETFLKETDCMQENFSISIKSNIMSGFGSSAAVITATLGVLNKYYQTKLTQFEMLKIGIKANYAVKGFGSGLDIGASIFGGVIKYHQGKKPIVLPYRKLNFVVGNTGIKAASEPIVKAVRLFESKYPLEAFEVFNEMERIVHQAENFIKKSRINNLGILMDKNQDLLRKLNVSSPILEEMIKAAKENGALGAKLSGAGIGDNMIALTRQIDKIKVINALNKTQGKALPEIDIDPNGLKVSETDY